MDTFVPGLTEIDTLYELKGFQLAAAFHQALAVVLIAVLLGFGIVQALYASSEENRFRKLIVYLVQAILVWFLLVPVDVKVNLPHDWAGSADFIEMIGDAGKSDLRPTIKAPRFLIWTHAAVDSLQRVLVGSVDKTFAKEPFSADRAVVLLRHAKIRNISLRGSYHAFVASCYVPLLAERRVQGLAAPVPVYDPFRVAPTEMAHFKIPSLAEGIPNLPDWMKDGTPCDQAVRGLNSDLHAHLQMDPTQREVQASIDEVMGKTAKAGNPKGLKSEEVLWRFLVYNETVGLLESREIKRLTEAVPDYRMFDGSTQSASNAQDLIDYVRSLASALVKIKQSVDQWIDHHAEGPKLYYKVVCYAPYIYGLSSMIFIALFPLAGFVALLPGRWTALFTWAKYLLWVKLWMVFWAILSSFNQWRYRLDDLGSDPENGIGDQTYIFPAIAAMYLLAPGLALVVVNLLTAGARAITNSVGGIAPGGGGAQGPDIGSMMPSPSNGGRDNNNGNNNSGGDSSDGQGDGESGGGGGSAASGAGEAAAAAL